MAYPEDDRLYEFELGHGGVHCERCMQLNGRIMTGKEWKESGEVPPIHPNCDCALLEVDENGLPPWETELSEENMIEKRIKLTMQGTPIPDDPSLQGGAGVGRFEVLAITAGEGNGWEFSEESLRESLALWDGASCFVDHSFWGHSVRDLCGSFTSPSWDTQARGIKLTLQPVGPSGPILAELGRQVLADNVLQRVGFSADLSFTAKGKQVEKVLKIYSVDLVIDPARGGAFLRTLNSLRKEEIPMPEENAQLEQDRAAVRDILAETERVKQEAEQARAVRVEMCNQLLDVALSNSHLPQAVTARVRKQFTGRVFDPAELTGAIDDARTMVSEITGGMVVQGPGRINAMFSSEDQLQAAVDDLLGAPRQEGHEKLNAAKLHGYPRAVPDAHR